MADRREWPSVHGRGALSFTERLLCAPFSPSSDGATAADASQCCSMPIRRANETARRWPRVLPVSGRAKDCSIDTYREHLRSFEREFPGMPEELAPIMGYLEQFGGETGRTKRNRQDTLNMLYKHAVQFFAMVKNPMLGLERPLVTKKRIRTLSLDQVPSMIRAPETPVERIALDMLLGHGWRQVEARRILVGDVDEIEDGLIWCRGKERDESTPILPKTETRLRTLAEGREPTERLLLSDKTRGGRRQPLGEDGMSQLVGRLYARAGIEGMTGHDLRGSFATLVRKSSGDDFLAMRLLRDKIPGIGERYIDFPMSDLRESLIAHSPVNRPESSDLPRLPRRGRSRVELGGDGGESNST